MALKVAEVLIKWRSEGTQQAEADTKKLGSALTDIGNKAKTAGALVTAGLTAPLTIIGKQAIDAASDLNESMSAVNTVFGSTASQVVNFSRTAASQLGQSRQAALSAASGMGALFKGVGLTEQQMADFSTSLLKASADLGSFHNADPGDVLGKLRSGLVGEVEGLRQFGILLNADAVEAKGLAMGLGDANDELSEGAKVQARYALIMEQLGAAQGDFARTSTGNANAQRILAARMQDIRAEIGTYLLPFQLKLNSALADGLGWFQGLSDKSKGLAVAIGAVAAAAGPVLVIAGQLMSSIGSLAPLFGALTGPLGLVALAVVGLGVAFKENWFGIRDTVTSVVGIVGETIGRMVQFFQSATERGLNPFAASFRAVIVALGEKLGADHPVVELFQGLYRNSQRLGQYIDQTLSPALSNLFSAISLGDGGKAGDIMEMLLGDLKDGWDRTVGPWFNELGPNIERAFRAVPWDDVGNTLGAGLKSAIQLLADFDKWSTPLLSEFGTWAARKIYEGWGPLETFMEDRAQDLFAPLVDSNIWNNTIAPWFQGTSQRIQTWFQDSSNWLVSAGTNMMDGLRHGAQDLWNNVVGPWIQGLQGDIQGLFSEAGRWLVSNGASLLSGLYDGITSIWNATLKPWLEKDLVTGIQGVFSDAGTWLSAQGSAILDGLRHGIQDYWNNTLSPWMGGMKTSFGNFFSGAGEWLTGVGGQILGTLFTDLKSMWTDIEEWASGLSIPWPEFGAPTLDWAGGGKPPKDDAARAMGGPLGKRYTLVGEYGPELLINRSLVMPHGAAQSRIQAMGGMAYGGTGASMSKIRDYAKAGDWGEWMAAQDKGMRNYVRQLRANGQLSAATRIQLMEGGLGRTPATWDSAVAARARRRHDRNSDFQNRANAYGDETGDYSAAGRRALRNHERNSDALNRANDYGDRTGSYSRRDRVLAREARSGTLQSGGLSRQEKQYLIANYGTINVKASDSNVARAIGDELSSRNR